MPVYELTDLDDARRYIQQGLWLQRRLKSAPPRIARASLEWSLEISSAGLPLPPVGFVADIGVEALDLATGEASQQSQIDSIGLASTVARAYEDQVLGRIYADSLFERAKHALKSYSPGKEQTRGVAFLVEQLQARPDLPGIILPPSIIRTMLDVSPEETARRGLESLRNDGLTPLLNECYDGMIKAARRTAEWLTEADVRALENRIALAADGERLAHELAIRAKVELRDALPQHKPRPLDRQKDVATQILGEDAYPVGGFSSISTRGGIESILQSQLAYMEQKDRPDLFDIKYLRDELYYYSRDENQFLRRRRRFVFALYPDLANIRIKVPDQTYQRMVYLLGLLLAAVEKLTQWLGGDDLQFDFVFLHDGESFPLRPEYDLLKMLLREQIANDTVRLYPSSENLPEKEMTPATTAPSIDVFASMHREKELTGFMQQSSRRHLCRLATVSIEDRPLKIENVDVARLILNRNHPRLAMEDETAAGKEALEWPEALDHLLRAWV